MWGLYAAGAVLRREMKAAGLSSDSASRLAHEREKAMADIGTVEAFVSGFYQGGLRSIGRSLAPVIVAVTPGEFVVFDGELTPDPRAEIGRIPRGAVTAVRAEDRSNPSVNDFRLFIDFTVAGGRPQTAEFRIPFEGTLLLAGEAWRECAGLPERQ